LTNLTPPHRHAQGHVDSWQGHAIFSFQATVLNHGRASLSLPPHLSLSGGGYRGRGAERERERERDQTIRMPRVGEPDAMSVRISVGTTLCPYGWPNVGRVLWMGSGQGSYHPPLHLRRHLLEQCANTKSLFRKSLHCSGRRCLPQASIAKL
jgi:hypothetical protein